MDDLSLSYLEPANDAERQQQLEELLLIRVTPIVRKILRRRLGFHVDQTGGNPNNQDAADLFQEIILNITQALRDLHKDTQATEIADLDKYVARTAINACHNFLRGKSPGRAHLRDNIESLLTRHPDFALWRDQKQMVAGFAIWQDHDLRPFFGQLLDETLTAFRDARFANEDIKLAPAPKVIAELLTWMDRPIQIDTLVNALLVLLQVNQQPNESLDDQASTLLETQILASTISAVSAVEAKELLSRTWRLIKRLPKQQRDAYCLTFEDDSGTDLFTLLLEMKIVTPVQIAEAMSRTVEEIVRLRTELPMDKAAAAVELNTTRSLVYKWRFLAMSMLRERLKQ